MSVLPENWLAMQNLTPYPRPTQSVSMFKKTEGDEYDELRSTLQHSGCQTWLHLGSPQALENNSDAST